MHYYKRNIGDYHKKAARLSILQHGVYSLLMDAIYDREVFPTREQALDWLWASSQDEIDAVDFVLSKFFTEENGVFVQKRIKEDLEKYHANAATNKRIAIEREANRKKNSTKRERTVHEAPPNHKPLTNNQEPYILSSSDDDLFEKPKIEKIPYQDIINLYHEFCPDLPKVMKLTDTRKNQIKARWNDSDYQCNNLDFWKTYFNHVHQSDFLNNRNTQGNFKADLQWITKLDNFVKVMEGKYV